MEEDEDEGGVMVDTEKDTIICREESHPNIFPTSRV